jgi:hypothetical protein
MSSIAYTTKRAAHGRRRQLPSGTLGRLGGQVPASRDFAGGAAHGQALTVAAAPRQQGKLSRGLWSWFHAHRLLKGPAGQGSAYQSACQSMEDDYQRLARGAHERAALWQR